MEQFIDKTEAAKYITLPKTFDWDLVDQEVGFGKVFQIFPKEVFDILKASEDESQKKIFNLLAKAGVCYSFVLAIPRIKVHVQNFGIQQFEDSKLKASPWWDVRDLGLSLLKVADKCMSDALQLSSEDESLKSEIPYFEHTSPFLPLPSDFEKIYSINSSPEVFSMLQKFINKALLLNVQEVLNEDCLAQISASEFLFPILQEALAYYSLYYASMLPGFVFTQNAVVIQYEELPWQKSVVLDSHAKILSGQNFLKLGDECLKTITNFIKKNISDFPCYSAPVPNRKMQARDSGIYL